MALPAEELAQLRARLAAYYAAEDAVLRNQSYEVDGRKLTRADLGAIQRMIDKLRLEVRTEVGTPIARGRMRRAYLA